MKKFWSACAALALLPAVAWADGLQALDNFMRTARAGQAQFTQTVISPAGGQSAGRSKNSSGEFVFQRPGQFKFVYQQPFAQTIVADGRTVWLYDEDLNQVTQRNQAQALGSTPAAILASAQDLASLQQTFELQSLPDADGMSWVQAVPRAADGQLRSVRVGFAGDALAAMDIVDGFGQRSVIRFHQMQVLPGLPSHLFRFQVPAGADVIAQ